MKSTESQVYDQQLQKDIKRFLVMHPRALLTHIEIKRSRYANWGGLSSILNFFEQAVTDMFLEFFHQPPLDFSDPRYPNFNLWNSLSEKYIYEVQRALCEQGWLCNKFDDIAHLPQEEQIAYLSNAIQQETTGQNQHTTVSLATAVLIFKIGPKQFCGCKDTVASKPPMISS
jgi:hypothetical protein